jgi:hypothetical protein
LLRIWEMVQIERFVPSRRGHIGRPPHAPHRGLSHKIRGRLREFCKSL